MSWYGLERVGMGFYGLVRVVNPTLHGGGHNGPPLAKSAPVHQGLYFEGSQLVDNSYLPIYYGVIFVSGPKIT